MKDFLQRKEFEDTILDVLNRKRETLNPKRRVCFFCTNLTLSD